LIKNFSFIATALAILFMSGCSNKADIDAAEVTKQALIAKEKAAEEATRLKAEADEAARLKAEVDEAARLKAEADEAARLKAEVDEAANSASVSDVETSAQEASAALSELDGAEDVKNDKIRIGKVELTKKKKAALNKLAEVLKAHPSVSIEVNSYTDAHGKEKRNLQLSKQRATLVKQYLVKQGIEASRISAVGHGESNFVDSSHKNSDKNRRIEVKVIK
jgi:outer membrane protein OmpA-like peptidoglycan-associated protein